MAVQSADNSAEMLAGKKVSCSAVLRADWRVRQLDSTKAPQKAGWMVVVMAAKWGVSTAVCWVVSSAY